MDKNLNDSKERIIAIIPHFDELHNWLKSEILYGFNVELEHESGVKGDLQTKNTLKIVFDHLSEFPNYYTDPKWGLLKMEKELKKQWNSSVMHKEEKSNKLLLINKISEEF